MNRTVRWIGVGVVFVLCCGVQGAQAQQRPVSDDEGSRQERRVVTAVPESPSRTVQGPPELVPALPVPRLVKFAGIFKDEQGQPRTGVVGVTFALYKEQEGGAALWLETQNVELDEQGRYSVLLGATKSEGLPLELFSSGEPRWLGVQVNLPKELEQPRVLLVSVPYALKAADAETLGGKPFSAFVLAQRTATASGTAGASLSSTVASSTAAAAPIAANFIPVFTDSSGTLGSSVMFQSASNNIGIGTTTPAAALQVQGDTLLVNSATTAQVQFQGVASEARFGQDFNGAFFASDTPGKAVRFYTNNGALNEGLRVTSASNVGIGTTTPSQKLEVAGNLKISGGGNALVFPDGTVMTSAGAGTNGGTITGVTAGTGLSGGGTAGGVTLGIDPTVVPQLGATRNTFTGSLTASSFNGSGVGLTNVNAATLGGMASSAFATVGTSNSFTGNQSITGNLSASGQLISTVATGTAPLSVSSSTVVPNLNSSLVGGLASTQLARVDVGNSFSGNQSVAGSVGLTGALALPNTTSGGTAGVIQLGSARFAHNFGPNNTFLGANAGNTSASLTGCCNTGVGSSALISNTTGSVNSAFGFQALFSNTMGNFNSAFGFQALTANTTGSNNSAFGISALTANTTGSNNSAFGAGALVGLTSGDSNIAIGFFAGQNLGTGTGNIYIGNNGTNESNTIRIGSGQTATFLPGAVRMGSETGTAEGPVVTTAPGYKGLVVRRINSTFTTALLIVARTDTMTLVRDGTAAGFRITVTAASGNFSIACLGLTSSTTVVGFTVSFVNPASTTVQDFNQPDLQQFNCSFGGTDEGHITEVNLLRHPSGSTWVGTVTSTFNQ